MAQPVSFLAKIWPTEPQARFLGAALAAGLALYLPRGSQEIALGRYLSANHFHPIQLNLFYKQDKIDQAHNNPKNIFLIGHLWELAHKVLATATLYLTLEYSMVAGIKTFLPAALRTSDVAQRIFQTLESPTFSNHIVFRLHLLYLTPILFKIVHFLLDKKSVEETSKPSAWQEWAYRWGKRAETLCYVRLATVAFGAAGRVGFAAFAIAAFAGFKTTVVHPPSRLGELAGINYAVQTKLQNCNQFLTLLGCLKTAKNEEKLGNDEFSHACGVALADLEKRLTTETFPKWTGGTLSELKNEDERNLRDIHAPRGVFEKFIDASRFLGTSFQIYCERIRFFIMLLGVNLRRLKARVDDQTITAQEAERIQDFLYLQTVENIQGKITAQDLMVCNLGEKLVSIYREWKGYRYLRKEGIRKDPFFKPIFDMLPLIDHSGSFLSGPLQLLFISLTLYLGKSTTTVPGIQHGSGDSASQQESGLYETRRSTNSAAHYQRYSQTPGAATKTFDEIVTICQGW